MIKYAPNSHGFAVWHTPDKISLQGFFKSWQLCVSQMDAAWDQNTCSSVQEPAGVDLMSGQSGFIQDRLSSYEDGALLSIWVGFPC